MKTRLSALATLALTTFALLGTACDPGTTTASVEEHTFRGEVYIPPTRPIGGSIVVGGGHDNPMDLILLGYDRAPIDIQLAFQAQVEQDILKIIEEDFLADERNYEECPWQCDELGATWDEGVNIQGMRYEHGAVTVAEDAAGLHWQTDASYEAEVGCGCI